MKKQNANDLLINLAKDLDNDVRLIRSGRLSKDRASGISSHAGKIIGAINSRTEIARLRKEKPDVPHAK